MQRLFVPLVALMLLTSCYNSSSTHAGRVVAINTQDDFKTFVESDNLIVAKFYAPWCGPCKRMGPDFEKVASKKKKTENNVAINYLSINIDQNNELANRYEVRSIPTTVIIYKGKEVGRLMGGQSRADIERGVDEAARHLEESDTKA